MVAALAGAVAVFIVVDIDDISGRRIIVVFVLFTIVNNIVFNFMGGTICVTHVISSVSIPISEFFSVVVE